MRNNRKMLLEELFTESNGCDVFTARPNAPYYDNILGEDLYHYVVKQVRGEIQYMSPDEYTDKVTEMQGSDAATQRAIMRDDRVKELLGKMQDGVKLDMPYLVYGEKYGEQEGRHRAMAAKEYGCDKIPVAVFTHVNEKELVRLAIELEHLNEEEAKERLLSKGFKNLDNYPTVQWTLKKLLENYDAPTEGSLQDKLGEWSDLVDGRGVSTLIKYQFNDYKDEMEFMDIYNSKDPDDYFLDKALDFRLGRSYDMLRFDEHRVLSRRIDILKYDWQGKLPKRLLDYIINVVEQYKESLDEDVDYEDHHQLVSIMDIMRNEIPECNAVFNYLQKLVYGVVRYMVISYNSNIFSFHTRKMRVAIGSKGATVAISNDIIIDDINEYESGHEMLVKSGIIQNMELGFKKFEDITDLDGEVVEAWYKKNGLNKII